MDGPALYGWLAGWLAGYFPEWLARWTHDCRRLRQLETCSPNPRGCSSILPGGTVACEWISNATRRVTSTRMDPRREEGATSTRDKDRRHRPRRPVEAATEGKRTLACGGPKRGPLDGVALRCCCAAACTCPKRGSQLRGGARMSRPCWSMSFLPPVLLVGWVRCFLFPLLLFALPSFLPRRSHRVWLDWAGLGWLPVATPSPAPRVCGWLLPSPARKELPAPASPVTRVLRVRR